MQLDTLASTTPTLDSTDAPCASCALTGLLDNLFAPDFEFTRLRDLQPPESSLPLNTNIQPTPGFRLASEILPAHNATTASGGGERSGYSDPHWQDRVGAASSHPSFDSQYNELQLGYTSQAAADVATYDHNNSYPQDSLGGSQHQPLASDIPGVSNTASYSLCTMRFLLTLIIPTDLFAPDFEFTRLRVYGYAGLKTCPVQACFTYRLHFVSLPLPAYLCSIPRQIHLHLLRCTTSGIPPNQDPYENADAKHSSIVIMPSAFTHEFNTPAFQAKISSSTGLFINRQFLDGSDNLTLDPNVQSTAPANA
ncbi:hypothetical protein C8R48DRAFT_776801 [Suillus tomentosus]|nr:hypothetical protein C8R48DRAFT_776801 [Suillus tomentosus]